MTCYNEHNNFRTSKNMEYYIETGCDRQVFVQGGFQLRRNFGEAVARVHHDLAVDFNSYKFFCDVLKNTPPRFRFFALNEAVLDLCKLLDERRNNKLALSNILMLQFSFCRIKTSSTGLQTALCAYTKRK